MVCTVFQFKPNRELLKCDVTGGLQDLWMKYLLELDVIITLSAQTKIPTIHFLDLVKSNLGCLQFSHYLM